MTQQEKRQELPRAQVITNQALSSFYRFIHIQASSGIVLLLVAIAAMIWANSSFSSSYHDLWHSTLAFNIAGFEVSQSLRFWINDGLMTLGIATLALIKLVLKCHRAYISGLTTA